jgi:hypothetical protein
MTMPVHAFTYAPSTPLRLLDWKTPAGFYSSGWGLLPFSLSGRSLERIELRQVNFMVEGLPYARIEGEAAGSPWPGYVDIQGKDRLALLMKSGTSVSYPWKFEAPLVLEVKIAALAGTHDEESGTVFEFDVRNRAPDGRTLSSLSASMGSSLLEDKDRGWKAASLRVEGMSGGGGALEFRYRCSNPASGAMGAFAEAILRPAHGGQLE